MHTSLIPYSDQGVSLEAYAAYPNGEKRPAVLLCHAWRGRDEFICEKAKSIAQLGYIGFALDLYGQGVLGQTKEENARLKQPFIEDRRFLQRRVLKGLEAAKSLPNVDPHRIAAIGFGFGGIAALDLARSGAPIKGAVSIYGHFDPPPKELIRPIQAKILILHGYKDPVVKQAELLAFEKEMNEAKVDWQAHIFGQAMHAFATEGVNAPEAGLQYDRLSAERAWMAVQAFLNEIF